MGLFRKKEEKRNLSMLPELPPLPELPTMPGLSSIQPLSVSREENEVNNLPSFPRSPSAERFSQAAIKQAVSEQGEELQLPSEDEAGIQPFPQSLQVKLPKDGPRTFEIAEFKPEKSTLKAEPLFVRIDKFESAMNNFGEIKKKIGEIDRLLRDIKEVRNKEEAELTGWEREIETIKSRLDSIDKEIFEKVE
ncbi:hypothetical protein HYT26_03720 [Candidatus Pacearchaeota archaeon]|nr:hypothetical protein [Candidatus Pacearchaeota archaeon]